MNQPVASGPLVGRRPERPRPRAELSPREVIPAGRVRRSILFVYALVVPDLANHVCQRLERPVLAGKIWIERLAVPLEMPWAKGMEFMLGVVLEIGV